MLTTVEKDALVWLSTSGGYSIPAKVVEVEPLTVHCITTNQIIQLDNTLRLTARKEFNADVENLNCISDESESALLLSLRKRFERKRIYTFAGEVLVALNPYETLSIYDDSVASLYRNNASPSRPAGESGSGKTTNLLQLARYIVASSRTRHSVTVEKIDAFHTVLSSFCCAKTRKNDTATRFGYALELLIKNGAVEGISSKSLLPLELSRLVSQKQGEKNFNVFYELCAGLEPGLQRKFGLKDSQKYFYLNLGKCAPDGEDAEEERFLALQKAMKTVEISEDQQTVIFRVLAAILHIGNLYFCPKKNSKGEEQLGVEIGNEAEVKWSAYLLEIDYDEWRSLFTSKKTAGENAASTPLTTDQALDVRDALAQLLYSWLVQWVLSLITSNCGCLNYNSTISLVDYYGFERYNNNAFEQLCVNIVNEAVENFYFKKIFKDVQEVYEMEGVTIDYQIPSWVDNKRVMDLLLKRPDGLVFLLDDECKFPKASNEGYLRRCDLNHIENGVYGKSRAKDRLEFAVKHFAGFTYYSVDQFVEKNRRPISAAAVDVLAESQNTPVAQFFKSFTINGKSLSGQDVYEYVAQSYGQRAKALMERMSKSESQFVRCLRSNNERQPQKFCEQTVIRQIRTYSLLDTVKINCRGYPVNMRIVDFAKRYACLLPAELSTYQNVNEKTNDILEQQGTKFHHHFAVGRSCVWLKDDLYQHLKKLRNEMREKSAVTIQKNFKGMLGRKKYQEKRHAAVVLQSGLRAWKARKDVENKRTELIKTIDLEIKRTPRPAAAEPKDEETVTVSTTEAVAAPAEQHVDLPADLQKQLRATRPPRMMKPRTVTHYNALASKFPVPKVSRQVSIEEFASSCFKGHLLGARREPIATPFLQKDSDREFNEALLIFSLILRYTNDTQMSEEKLGVLAKYIIQKGIEMPEQRDEIYAQLCNQTYNNRVPTSLSRAWTLMLAACNSFAPSIHIFPMLMSYFQDLPKSLSSLLISGLLRRIRNKESPTNRYLASTFIEQAGFKTQQPSVLRIQYPSNEEADLEADSWMTAEEMARKCLRLKGIGEPEGWSVSLADKEWIIDSAGNQYLYDLVAQRELIAEYDEKELAEKLNSASFVIFDSKDIGRGELPEIPDNLMNASPERQPIELLDNPPPTPPQHLNAMPSPHIQKEDESESKAENERTVPTAGYRVNTINTSDRGAVHYKGASSLPLQRFGDPPQAVSPNYVCFTRNDLYQETSGLRQDEHQRAESNQPETQLNDVNTDGESEEKRYRQKQQEFSEFSRQDPKTQFAYVPPQFSMPFMPGVHFMPVMLPTTSFVPPQLHDSLRQSERSFSESRSYSENQPYRENPSNYGDRSYTENRPFDEKRNYTDQQTYSGNRSFGENRPYGENYRTRESRDTSASRQENYSRPANRSNSESQPSQEHHDLDGYRYNTMDNVERSTERDRFDNKNVLHNEPRLYSESRPYVENRGYSDDRASLERRPYGENQVHSEKRYQQEDRPRRDNRAYLERQPYSEDRPQRDSQSYPEDQLRQENRPQAEHRPYNSNYSRTENISRNDNWSYSDKRPRNDDRDYENDRFYNRAPSSSQPQAYGEQAYRGNQQQQERRRPEDDEIDQESRFSREDRAFQESKHSDSRVPRDDRRGSDSGSQCRSEPAFARGIRLDHSEGPRQQNRPDRENWSYGENWSYNKAIREDANQPYIKSQCYSTPQPPFKSSKTDAEEKRMSSSVMMNNGESYEMPKMHCREVITEEDEAYFANSKLSANTQDRYMKDQRTSYSADYPSATSRIRQMQIPLNEGEVNDFLDKIFDEVLPQDELARTSEAKMNAAMIKESIKGGANGPAPASAPSGEYHMLEQYSAAQQQFQPPSQSRAQMPQADYANYPPQPMMFMMPIDGRSMMQQQSMMGDTSADNRCLSPMAAMPSVVQPFPVVFPSMIPSNMMVCMPPKQGAIACISPVPIRTEGAEDPLLINDFSFSPSHVGNSRPETQANGKEAGASQQKPSATMIIRSSPLPMSVQPQANKDENSRLGQLAPTSAKARYVGLVHPETNEGLRVTSETHRPVSASIKQIQQEALSKVPPAPPLLGPQNPYMHPQQAHMYYQSALTDMRLNGELRLRGNPPAVTPYDDNFEMPHSTSTKPPTRLHRIAFEEYTEPAVQGDIVNSEHIIPGKLPIPPPPAKTSEVERDAMRKLREKAKDLPPPVDEARFLKPNVRKKQMDLHFKPLPQDEPPVRPPHEEGAVPIEPEIIEAPPQRAHGEWMYHSDIVKEDMKETRVRNQQLHGNFYARGVEVPKTASAEAQTTPLVNMENGSAEQSEQPKQKEKPAVQYELKPWSLTIRKELFTPYEQLDDIQEIDLLFSQIIADCRKPNRYRIRQYEREAINTILRDHAVNPADLDHPEKMPVEVKINIIDSARRWPLYFSRFYNVVEERDKDHVNRLLGVSESGVRLIARNLSNASEPLFISDHFEYADIAELVTDKDQHLQIATRKGLIITIRSDQVEQIQNIIEKYMTGAGKNKVFVRATADYITKEPNLLSFKKDDVIQIISRNDQKRSNNEEWLFGKIGNRYGNLPANYVEALEPPPDYGDRFASEHGFSRDDSKDDSKFTMAQFAKIYFRAPKHATKDKDWTWKDITEKVKYTERPISHSLLKLEGTDVDKLAVEAFLCLMRYMGDESLKRGQTLTDCVYELLTICHQNFRMRDEVYCQIVKQTTNNKSPRTDSGSRGWRLFSILCAYFDCSLVFKPYLFKYLSDTANDPKRAFHGAAANCLQNLTKTFKYGGRKVLLSGAEVEAITMGKTLRHLVYQLPGGHKQLINTTTVTVAEEIIQELCQELNVLSAGEQQEFCLCTVLYNEDIMKMISNDEYILDICTELEAAKTDYIFMLKRTVWIHPLRLDNNLYIDFMFFQVIQEYMDYYLTNSKMSHISASALDDVAYLGAYLHLSDSETSSYVEPEMVPNLIPKTILAMRSPEQWADRVNRKLTGLDRGMPAVEARAKFLELLEKWPLFGSQFFSLRDAVSGSKHTGQCLLAINKHGLKFLNAANKHIADVPLSQVLTTNKYNTAQGSFLDIKVGKLSEKRTLTLETDKGSEISRLLGQYIYVDSKNRGYINGSDTEML